MYYLFIQVLFTLTRYNITQTNYDQRKTFYLLGNVLSQIQLLIYIVRIK